MVSGVDKLEHFRRNDLVLGDFRPRLTRRGAFVVDHLDNPGNNNPR